MCYLNTMPFMFIVQHSAQLFSGNSISKLNKLLPPANKVCKGYVHVSVILPTRGVVSQHTLQASRPTPRGGVEGSGQRGVSRPTPGGLSRPTPRGSLGPHPGGGPSMHSGRHPPRGQLLPWVVRIPLECILVSNCHEICLRTIIFPRIQ